MKQSIIVFSRIYSKNLNNVKLSKRDLLKLLETATSKSSFTFDYVLYGQVDGFVMGSPLGPTLADAFPCHYEKECLYNCPIHFKPIAQKSYVDDVFFHLKNTSNAL